MSHQGNKTGKKLIQCSLKVSFLKNLKIQTKLFHLNREIFCKSETISKLVLHFSQFIFIDKYLKFKKIEYFIHYTVLSLKCE